MTLKVWPGINGVEGIIIGAVATVMTFSSVLFGAEEDLPFFGGVFFVWVVFGVLFFAGLNWSFSAFVNFLRKRKVVVNNGV